MFEISFDIPQVGSPWRSTWDVYSKGDPAVISEIDLRYKLFSASVSMIAGDTEFISKNGHVTLVDLALSFCWVIGRVARGQESSFGFTESLKRVKVSVNGEAVEISCSWIPDRAIVARDKATEVMRSFVCSAYGSMIDEVPEVVANPVFRRIRSCIR